MKFAVAVASQTCAGCLASESVDATRKCFPQEKRSVLHVHTDAQSVKHICNGPVHRAECLSTVRNLQRLVPLLAECWCCHLQAEHRAARSAAGSREEDGQRPPSPEERLSGRPSFTPADDLFCLDLLSIRTCTRWRHRQGPEGSKLQVNTPTGAFE